MNNDEKKRHYTAVINQCLQTAFDDENPSGCFNLGLAFALYIETGVIKPIPVVQAFAAQERSVAIAAYRSFRHLTAEQLAEEYAQMAAEIYRSQAASS